MRKLWAVIVLMFLLSGCKSDERILERLGMVQTSSYDLSDDDMLKVTSSIPVVNPESQSRRELLMTEADSIKEARLLISRKTELFVVSGQLRNVLFGLNLTKAGLGGYLDTLMRDPSVALGVRVTVVDGDAGTLLSKDYKQHADTGQYIDHLLQKESGSNSIPQITLYDFSRDYNDDGIDPIAPIIQEMEDHVVIEGIACFEKDRYRMKIPAADGMTFALLRGSLKQGEVALDLGESGGRKRIVMFSSLVSQRKLKVIRSENPQFKVKINVFIQGSVLEYTGSRALQNKAERQELENEISAKLSSEGNKIIRNLQQHHVDSLGIGQYVRNSLSHREWKETDWSKVYPLIEIEFHPKVIIKDYGKYN